MRLILAMLTCAFLGGCSDVGNEESAELSAYEYSADTIEMPSDLDSRSSEGFTFKEPQVPTHYYDAQDGVFYSYFAAISEDDRKAGKAANDVITFAYLGIRNGQHVLASVRPNKTVFSEAYCSEPCRVITYKNGQQLAYSERSIIGGAFADAIAGRLQIASYNIPETRNTPALKIPSMPAYTRPPESTIPPEDVQSPESDDSSNEPVKAQNWSKREATQIGLWLDANTECKGGNEPQKIEDACANRDNVYGPALTELGICYGQVYQPSAERTMHKCEADSIALD